MPVYYSCDDSERATKERRLMFLIYNIQTVQQKAITPCKKRKYTPSIRILTYFRDFDRGFTIYVLKKSNSHRRQALKKENKSSKSYLKSSFEKNSGGSLHIL
jgi:hypothetical protein